MGPVPLSQRQSTRQKKSIMVAIRTRSKYFKNVGNTWLKQQITRTSWFDVQLLFTDLALAASIGIGLGAVTGALMMVALLVVKRRYVLPAIWTRSKL